MVKLLGPNPILIPPPPPAPNTHCIFLPFEPLNPLLQGNLNKIKL